mmetsp:Transcript_18158/g.25121  ORF Transcript_18158/g.25121 Transcript_18158/m.25121 type:complete len:191 (+) Transcript_18158:48-620(+)
MEDTVVCPGERLFPTEGYCAGPGTYVKGHQICAALVGKVQVIPADQNATDQSATVKVSRSEGPRSVPHPGDTVTVKVNKINARMAVVDILCIGERALDQSFSGIIRQQDVRATEIDKVQIVTSFRPGDVVRAEVLSLGDARSYYLSTAKTEYGVVYAKTMSGNPMVAISWQEMQCPKTLEKSFRKVAKVV